MARDFVEDIECVLAHCGEFEETIDEDLPPSPTIRCQLEGYFNACLNELQQNRTKDEYLELMLKMEKLQELIRHNTNKKSINDINNDDEFLDFFCFMAKKSKNNEDYIVNFVEKYRSSKNYIENIILKAYKNTFDKQLDLTEFSQEFKDSIKQHQFKSNIKYKTDNIKYYLDRKDFDNNQTDQAGYTLMTYVCKVKDAETAYNIFLRDDIDINQPDEVGDTPFIVACQYNPDLALKIVQHDDIDLNAKNNSEQTAFHCAVMEHPELAIALMDYDGIDINEPDDDGDTPFMSASVQHNECAYAMLKRDDIDFNAKDKQGRTAFMLSICDNYINDIIDESLIDEFTGEFDSNYLDYIITMIKHEKIDTGVKDNQGYTAYDCLKQEEHQQIRQYLKGLDEQHKLSKTFGTENKEIKSNNKIL